MKNLILKYGIISGLISSIVGTLNWFVIAKPLGVTISQTVGFTTIALVLLCIPLGVKYYKNNINNGVISLKESFKIGFGITSVSGIVMAIHSIIFFALQKDEFLEWQIQDMTDAELLVHNQQMAETPDFVFTPLFQGLVMFVMVFLFGALITVITAYLFRKKGV